MQCNNFGPNGNYANTPNNEKIPELHATRQPEQCLQLHHSLCDLSATLLHVCSTPPKSVDASILSIGATISSIRAFTLYGFAGVVFTQGFCTHSSSRYVLKQLTTARSTATATATTTTASAAATATTTTTLPKRPFRTKTLWCWKLLCCTTAVVFTMRTGSLSPYQRKTAFSDPSLASEKGTYAFFT